MGRREVGIRTQPTIITAAQQALAENYVGLPLQ